MEFVLIGVIAGFIAGFFGVGGGIISVPLLLFAGVPIKFAIGISSMQMMFSSIYGSIKNIKNRSLKIKDNYLFGAGAIVGAFIGGLFLDKVDPKLLGITLCILILFALIRIFFTTTKDCAQKKIKSIPVNLIIGLIIGIISGMLGIGGAIILIPILVAYMHFSTKDASSAGLFFVIFSSVSSFLTLSMLGYVDYEKGGIVAISSLVGVKIAQMINEKIDTKNHKKWMILLYLALFAITTYKVI